MSIEKVVTSIDPVVLSIFDNKLNLLLIERDKEPYVGKYAIPGGVVVPSIDNTLEEALNRILKEKTGIKINYVERLQSMGSSVIDPRSWTVCIAYFALVEHQEVIVSNAKWVPVNELKNYDFGFEHHKVVISKALERLTNKVNYSTLPVDLMQEEFTLPELQKIYEILLGEKLDKSSFRKKILETGVIKDTGKFIKKGAFRPSLVYKKVKGEPVLFDKNIF